MTKFLVLLVVMLGSMRASPSITVEFSKVANIPTSVLPYSVAVTNNGTEPIAGIDVLFTLTPAGRTVRRNFFYHSFGRNQPLISSGQSRVFTPLKSATAVASGNRGGSDTFDDAALTILASADTIHVSVDLVVAVDGRSAGADIAKTVKKLTQQKDSYTAMRSECLARLARGQPDAAIAQWLTPLAQQKVFRDAETGAGDRYAGTQVSLARQWLSSLKAGRRAELVGYLTALTPELNFPVIASLRGGLQ